MCELFGMAARHPANVTLSLAELARHGGETDHHADGWGIAYYCGASVEILREAAPASGSDLVRFLLDNQIESHIVVAHVRKATQGRVALCNTQPFVRTMGGRDHVFAHNGHLLGLDERPRRFAPHGDTDSERAFCLLLDRMAELWDGHGIPSLDDRRAVFEAFAAEMARHGPANFLYSDGDALLAHGHERTQRPGLVAPPGLHLLERSCDQPGSWGLTGLLLESEHVDQHVQLVASVPLSAEPWTPLPGGTVLSLAG